MSGDRLYLSVSGNEHLINYSSIPFQRRDPRDYALSPSSGCQKPVFLLLRDVFFSRWSDYQMRGTPCDFGLKGAWRDSTCPRSNFTQARSCDNQTQNTKIDCFSVTARACHLPITILLLKGTQRCGILLHRVSDTAWFNYVSPYDVNW